ncbi:ankyrin repeat domain-containing protein [bacterium]|nr:MAG: ankyrin repeat domain-containing protein [bacterium]
MSIHRDASRGDSEAVSRALDAGVAVDVPDDSEMTPLMMAVSSPQSNTPTVQLLLERGANPNAAGGYPFRPVLGHALKLNEPEYVRLLVEAGADVEVTDEDGFDALIWAADGDTTHLLEVVELLLSNGASAEGESDDGDSAVGTASRRGRFDVVRRLLEAGAYEGQLGWTPLMRSIALEPIQEVQAHLVRRTDLIATDSWDRTPWLLAVAVADLQKMRLLLAAGANRDDVGHSGKTALMYSVENNSTEILQWLIAEQFDLEATDDFGKTALMAAASRNSFECVRLLLDAGADASKADYNGQKAISHTSSVQVFRLLAAAGQDLNELDPTTRALLLGLEHEGEVTVSREDFEVGQYPRFGSANPEKMDVAFWRAMVQSGSTAYAAHQQSAPNGVAFKRDDEDPTWTYHRQGKSITQTPDGRFIEIGGSHEDFYDPHFHVYNDVFVHYPDGSFEIYGYPAEVFPPTDHHSATLVGDYIYIIGCMGDMDTRVVGHTPVYRLNINTLAIEKVVTTGKGPGCISMHKGTLVDNEIHVCGGECIDLFVLNLDTHQWRRQSA